MILGKVIIEQTSSQFINLHDILQKVRGISNKEDEIYGNC